MRNLIHNPKLAYGFITMGSLLNLAVAVAQEKNRSVLFESKGKLHLYYVALYDSGAKVYEMGSYFDKAGSGYSIRWTDTLARKDSGIYVGKDTRIISEKDKRFLVIPGRRNMKFQLDSLRSAGKVHADLNNAYYLDKFFLLCNELNQRYPLNHYSFRNAFYSWKELENKESDHEEFRIYANHRLQEMKDSISQLHNYYSSLANSLVQNIGFIEYLSLKDSILKLPTGHGSTSQYFNAVIRELSKQKPEYFFRLAEELPDQRTVIFMSVDNSKDVIERLKAVENHHKIKDDFFKDRRSKAFLYRIIGTWALVIGAIAYIIAR